MSRTGTSLTVILATVVLLATSCGGGEQAAPPAIDNGPVAEDSGAAPDVGPESPVGAEGAIIVMIDNVVFRIPADGAADPTDLSASLDEHSQGHDAWIASSRNGEWLILDTERFGCEDWSCLVIAPSDLSEVSVVIVDDELVHPQDWGAISDDGSLLVITTDAGQNDLDLAVLRHSGTGWSAPVVITGLSPHSFNERGRLIDNGSAVLFDCGPSQYGQEGTGVCRVAVDGTGFERLISPKDGVGSTSSNAARSADIAPNGNLVFEADWGGTERIWRELSDGSTELVSGFGNDNSPCVLPDGSVASLWLNRDGNDQGLHELKVHASDSTDYEMLLADLDVIDVGIHCSN